MITATRQDGLIPAPDGTLRMPPGMPHGINHRDHVRITARPVYRGSYEYLGVQRTGKSTLMTDDYLRRVLPQAPDRPVVANYWIDLPRHVNYTLVDNDTMVQIILWVKAKGLRDWIFLFDEMGQRLGARSWASKEQTEIANFMWQVPKRGHLWLYSDNPGNSVDVVIRDATQFTLVPRYIGPKNPFTAPRSELEAAYLKFWIIDNHQCKLQRGVIRRDIYWTQRHFDTNQPIN